MSAALTVRAAGPDDLAHVLALLDEDAIREVAEDRTDLGPYAAALAEIAASGHAAVLVGELGGAIVATAQVSWLRRLMYRGSLVCQVESVRVASASRGHGIGTALMRWIVDDARARGCARVELTSNAARVEARRFYERLGFLPTHVGFKLYLGG